MFCSDVKRFNKDYPLAPEDANNLRIIKHVFGHTKIRQTVLQRL